MSYILLGNLSVEEIESRLGVSFSKEVKDYMTKNHEMDAMEIPIGKWHGFDTPFSIYCGDEDTKNKIENDLKDKLNKCKETITIYSIR
jgi:hypothetical protein